MEKKLLSTVEVSQILFGESGETNKKRVLKMIHKNQVNHKKIGTRYFVTNESLKTFLESDSIEETRAALN